MGNGPEDPTGEVRKPVVESAVAKWSPGDIRLAAQWQLGVLKKEGYWHVKFEGTKLFLRKMFSSGETEETREAEGYLSINDPRSLDALVKYYELLSVQSPVMVEHDLE